MSIIPIIFLGGAESAVAIEESHFVYDVICVCQTSLAASQTPNRGALRSFQRVFDTPYCDILECVDEAVALYRTSCLSARPRALLVHCEHGMSRSPILLAAVLASAHGLHARCVYELIKRKRGCVGANSGFLFQLELLDTLLRNSAIASESSEHSLSSDMLRAVSCYRSFSFACRYRAERGGYAACSGFGDDAYGSSSHAISYLSTDSGSTAPLKAETLTSGREEERTPVINGTLTDGKKEPTPVSKEATTADGSTASATDTMADPSESVYSTCADHTFAEVARRASFPPSTSSTCASISGPADGGDTTSFLALATAAPTTASRSLSCTHVNEAEASLIAASTTISPSNIPKSLSAVESSPEVMSLIIDGSHLATRPQLLRTDAGYSIASVARLPAWNTRSTHVPGAEAAEDARIASICCASCGAVLATERGICVPHPRLALRRRLIEQRLSTDTLKTKAAVKPTVSSSSSSRRLDGSLDGIGSSVVMLGAVEGESRGSAMCSPPIASLNSSTSSPEAGGSGTALQYCLSTKFTSPMSSCLRASSDGTTVSRLLAPCSPSCPYLYVEPMDWMLPGRGSDSEMLSSAAVTSSKRRGGPPSYHAYHAYSSSPSSSSTGTSSFPTSGRLACPACSKRVGLYNMAPSIKPTGGNSSSGSSSNSSSGGSAFGGYSAGKEASPFGTCPCRADIVVPFFALLMEAVIVR